MATSRLTRRGQVTIPKAVRAQLGLAPGDEIEFVAEDGVFRIRKRQEESPFAPWRDYLADKPIPGLEGLSVDELIEEMRGR